MNLNKCTLNGMHLSRSEQAEIGLFKLPAFSKSISKFIASAECTFRVKNVFKGRERFLFKYKMYVNYTQR